MKQILYSILAFLGVLSITSCSNDDILIETSAKTQNLTYTVNTQSLYDTFEMTSNIQDIIRDQKFGIGVYTLVYDKNGNLYTSRFHNNFTFTSVTDSYELPEGEYTIITIESLSGSNDKYETIYWDINGIDKISTLQIEQLRNEVYWQFVIGVCTNNVTVTEGNNNITAIPSAIGSLINLYFYNFNNSPYPAVCFGTKDVIDSYRLDPALSEADRYNITITDSDHFRARGLSTVDGQSQIHIDRYVLESSIDWSFRFAEDENDYQNGSYTYWKVNSGKYNLQNGQRYYGGYYFTGTESTGMVYFGDKQGFLSWIDEVNNSIKFVPDVYTTWGGSVNDAQIFMTGYDMILGSQGKAALDEVSGYYLLQYAGKGKEQSILYNFTSETTGLFETDIIYDASDETRATILNYLNSNYSLLQQDGNMAFYVSPDYSTIASIMLVANSNYYLSFLDVNFLNVSGAPSRFINPKALNRAIKTLKEIPSSKKMQLLNNSEVNNKKSALPGIDYLLESNMN